ncbi:hypothetical protein M0802_002489 [Mischocyttarus mexicanus]|nr:hypothetical protein M0802_002489 [Mischocyttarus mexicanus]
MLVKCDLVFFVSIVFVQGQSSNDLSKKESFDNPCDFGTSRKLYDSIDFFRCINELASNSKISEIDSSRKNDYIGQAYYKNSPWSDLIVSLFNGESNTGYQIPQLLNTGSSQYQSNQHETTVGGLFESSGGLNINLFDALYSISRYDDLKCVPRILCEVASGVTPGESIYYGRDTNMFNNLFDKNILLKLLTNFNFAESSPILSFGKAALLGYTSKSNPRNCYQEYPKCPRNPDQLIHYLNNHNGGFFRYFNKYNNNNNLYNKLYVAQRNNEYLNRNRLSKSKQNPAPSPGFGKISSDRSGTGELKFDADTLNDTRYYEPRIRNQINHRVVFPNDEEPTKFVDSSNRLPKTLFDFEAIDDTDDTQHHDSNFFPRVTDEKQQTREEKYDESNLVYDSSQQQQSTVSSLKSFVFPDD